jgi:hydrogenase nickel incorporation protein HypB
LEARLLAKNDEVAWANRTWLAAHDVVTLNLMGAPGAGKTALLERTVPALGGEVPVSVLEGDQDTERDAERIRAIGANVAQINTGPGCHLDAEMVARGIEGLAPPPGSLMFVENVGNLVCPALFDLGEHLKVVVLSVTEGDDKPLKYPHMFRVADALVLHKIDLLPHVPFDLERGLENARRVRPGLRTFGLSSQTGEGLDAWLAWLRRIRPAAKASARLGGAAP